VAPMIFLEAFLPSARRFFHYPTRFPIADAHYAMGFAFLFQMTNDEAVLQRAFHFLQELKKTRCPEFEEYCWGYPYDWVTRNGTIKANTPLITSTPYMFEAFLQVHEIQPRAEWLEMLGSIARHVANDIKDFPTSSTASSCSYSPFEESGVINASAYRAFCLTSAANLFQNEQYAGLAERTRN